VYPLERQHALGLEEFVLDALVLARDDGGLFELLVVERLSLTVSANAVEDGAVYKRKRSIDRRVVDFWDLSRSGTSKKMMMMSDAHHMRGLGCVESRTAYLVAWRHRCWEMTRMFLKYCMYLLTRASSVMYFARMAKRSLCLAYITFRAINTPIVSTLHPRAIEAECKLERTSSFMYTTNGMHVGCRFTRSIISSGSKCTPWKRGATVSISHHTCLTAVVTTLVRECAVRARIKRHLDDQRLSPALTLGDDALQLFKHQFGLRRVALEDLHNNNNNVNMIGNTPRAERKEL
jgi:hypothetical protein